jgi:hypothetical protein
MGLVIGVAHVVSETRPLATDLTYPSHFEDRSLKIVFRKTQDSSELAALQVDGQKESSACLLP